MPVYPGYVIAIAASFLIGKPVKWIEDRSENLQADSFARDYHMTVELASTKEGKMTGLRIKTLADHGYTDAAANPSKFPSGLFSIVTGSYDIPTAFTEMDAVYTNKPPGGVAYRCSFRVTEAVHAIERITDVLAQKLDGIRQIFGSRTSFRKISSPTAPHWVGNMTLVIMPQRCVRQWTWWAMRNCARNKQRNVPEVS